MPEPTEALEIKLRDKSIDGLWVAGKTVLCANEEQQLPLVDIMETSNEQLPSPSLINRDMPKTPLVFDPNNLLEIPWLSYQILQSVKKKGRSKEEDLLTMIEQQVSGCAYEIDLLRDWTGISWRTGVYNGWAQGEM